MLTHVMTSSLLEVVENEHENNIDTKYAPIRLGFSFCGKGLFDSSDIIFISNCQD